MKQRRFFLHLKTNGIYELLHTGKNEATLEPVVIYRSTATEEIWVRPLAQFFDGRFEELNDHENNHHQK